MAKHKYTRDEVATWQEEHHRYYIYVNKDDKNLFVHRGRTGIGFTMNLAHPLSWLFIAAIIAIIVLIEVYRTAIFG